MRRLPLLLSALSLLALPRAAHAAPPEGAPLVRVHIEAEPGVTLARFDPSTHERTVVCVAPCDRELPSGLLYVVGGRLRESNPFELKPQAGGRASLDVSGGSKGAFAGGILALSLGGATATAGLIVMASGVPAALREEPDKTTFHVGELILSGGSIAMVVGAVLMLANATSRVDSQPEPERVPTWTKPTNPEGPPSTLHVPLAAMRF